MVKEVYKNIYTFQVVLPKSPLKATNIYIIKDRDKNLVLDTGYHTQETLDSMLAGLADLGLEMSDTDLFISHMHADHSGLTSNFKSAGCKVYASAADGKIINDAANGSYWQLLYKLLDYFNVTGGETMAHVFHMVKRWQVHMDEREGVLYFIKLDDKYDPSWLKSV